MGALTTALTVASVANKAYGAISTARAGAANQRAANRMANDVEAQGAFEAERAQRDLSRLLGAQRTILGAGQGLDVNQGTARLIREETTELGEADINQIRLNAAREAWGIRAQGRIDRRAANNQAIAQGIDAGTTLLTAGVDQWSRYQKTAKANMNLAKERMQSSMRKTSRVARKDFMLGGGSATVPTGF